MKKILIVLLLGGAGGLFGQCTTAFNPFARIDKLLCIPPATVTPAGSNTQFQINSSGSLGATSGFTWILASGVRDTNAPAASTTLARWHQGSTLSSGNAQGTYWGVNAANGYTGDYINLQLNGVNVFKVDYTGLMTLGGTGTGVWEPFCGTAPGNATSGYMRVFCNGSSLIQWKDSSGTVKTAVDTDTAQVLTAKDITATKLNVPHSTTLPATCVVGDSYMDTDATTAQRWYLCESTNTWVAQGGGGGGSGSMVYYFRCGASGTLNNSTGFCTTAGYEAAESLGRVPAQKAGTLKNLRVQPYAFNNFQQVVTLMVNNVDTTITVTVTASASGGTFFNDTTHTASVSAGDNIACKVVAASGGTSAMLGCGWEIQ